MINLIGLFLQPDFFCTCIKIYFFRIQFFGFAGIFIIMENENEPLIKELADLLVDANTQLIECTDEHQINLITVYVQMVITSYSQQIAFETNQSLNSVVKLLTKINQQVYDTIKNVRDNTELNLTRDQLN